MTQTPCIINVKIKTVTAVVFWCVLASAFVGMYALADNGKPDLTLLPDALIINPDDIFEYDQVKINVTVKNIGSSTAENIGVALYINSRNNPVDEYFISSMEADEEVTVNLYWIAQPVGNHTFYIFLDFNELIDEMDEDNNIGSGTIDVKQPVYPPFPPEPENAVWWNPSWHYRVPLSVTMLGQHEGYVYEDKTVHTSIDFTELMNIIADYQPSGGFSKRTFLPGAVRVVRYERINDSWVPQESLGREIIFMDDYDAVDRANITLIWVLSEDILPHETRYYYIYWDTVENGPKSGAFDTIPTGIKNCEFEDDSVTVWRNESEPVIPVSQVSNIVGWDIGYVNDPVNGDDQSYYIHREGLVWQQDWYGKLYQSFTVPDGGGAASYLLNARVFFDADFEEIQWEIALDGHTIEMGSNTDGWLTLRENVTTHLEGKTSYKPTVSFKVKVTENILGTTTREVSAYIDSCWIETTPNPPAATMINQSHGWWGDIGAMKSTYVAGAAGMNSFEVINASANAHPREVIAMLYSPNGQFVTSSLPLPDAGFEGGGEYSYLFFSNEQTTSASFTGTNVAHSGNKAVELRLSDYTGNYQFMDQPVEPDDTAGLRQTIAQSVHISKLPNLYFYYKADQYTTLSELNYTVLIEGGPDKFLSISMGALTKDGDWHKYEIPGATLEKWKTSAGTVVGLEIRLIANVESGENTVYIDDLGYSFMPSQNGVNRKSWHLEELYTFQNGTNIGTWRLEVTMADGSEYIVVRSISINVNPAANIDIISISAPAAIKEGKDTTITVDVKNQGPKNIESTTPINITLTIYQGDVSTDAIRMTKAIPGLLKGETKQVSFQWHSTYGDPLYGGEWTIIAKANEDESIPEWNKADNWNTLQISVISLPDLQISMSDIDFNPSHPTINDTVDISVIVRNVGYNDTMANIQFFIKNLEDRTYKLINSGAINEIIGRRNYTTITLPWQPVQNGTFSIKIMVSCDDESTLTNNDAVKNIRVGGPVDQDPPIITNIRIDPTIQVLGGNVNISAFITDNHTTVNKALVTVSKDGAEYLEEYMWRLGDTDVFYYSQSFNEVGYYACQINAFDTAGNSEGTEWENIGSSDVISFRIVYDGVETTPPSIRAIAASPQKQVIYGTVNISALINDSSSLTTVTLHIIHNNDEQAYEMSQRGITDIYYFAQAYDETGIYEYYIEAVDASANSNKYNTTQIYRYFIIPIDYDGDDVPDSVEIEAGTDPKDSDTTINVSIGNQIGYLLWKEDDSSYVYWSKNANELRSIEEKLIDNHKVILFDVGGDGTYDYHYNTVTGTIVPYQKISEAGLDDSIWIIPAIVLFGIICGLFIAIKRKS